MSMDRKDSNNGMDEDRHDASYIHDDIHICDIYHIHSYCIPADTCSMAIPYVSATRNIGKPLSISSKIQFKSLNNNNNDRSSMNNLVKVRMHQVKQVSHDDDSVYITRSDDSELTYDTSTSYIDSEDTHTHAYMRISTV